MRIMLLLLVVVVISILWPSDLSFGACPEDTMDNGICDTLYVEIFPPDTLFTGPGQLVRVPIFVTHDVSNPNVDSIADFAISLCYTHTNPAKYCSVSQYWNNTFYQGHNLPRSIFRNLVLPSGDTLYNWMLRVKEMGDLLGENWRWNVIFAQYDTSHFRLNLYQAPYPLGVPMFGEGSRVLLATVTFRVEDTMTICLDSCRQPPWYETPLVFSCRDCQVYVPRDNMPYCFSLSCPKRGDVNADCIINLGDVVYLTSYLYRGGSPPVPLETGDTNCDGIVELGDVVKLKSYLYRGGSPPCSP
jgi:hypothetical protein